MADPVNIKSILLACLEQNRQAQKQLYTFLAPLLYAICLRYTKNRDDANDALQDSFILIFKNLNTFQHTGSFEGWAKRITVNALLNRIKKNDLLKNSVDIDERDSLHPGESPRVQEQYDFDSVLHLVNQLPEGRRRIFNLHVIDGFDHEEIASMLMITENTSRSQLARAKETLRELLRKQEK